MGGPLDLGEKVSIWLFFSGWTMSFFVALELDLPVMMQPMMECERKMR